MSDLRDFIAGMPKCELHVHLEGTLEPEMKFELAKRNGMTLPYKDVGEMRAAYNFHDLPSFLKIYYEGMRVLVHEPDFYDLTFAYLAKALVIFPGGFGTMDELFEILTLAQTDKLAKKILVVIYGSEYWNRILNFQAFADAGTISPDDVNQFKIVDTPEEAFEYLRDGLTKYHLGGAPKKTGEVLPEIAKTRP